jgi:hypothetical protein
LEQKELAMDNILSQIIPGILQQAASRRTQAIAPVKLYLPMEYGSWIANISIDNSDDPAAEYPASELYFSPGLTRGRVDSSGI